MSTTSFGGAAATGILAAPSAVAVARMQLSDAARIAKADEAKMRLRLVMTGTVRGMIRRTYNSRWRRTALANRGLTAIL
jgi:hypothetical protein